MKKEISEKHICCPSHCCQIHGCKYGYKDCPVETKKIMGMTGGCETCGLLQSGYYGTDAAIINELELEIARLKAELSSSRLSSGRKENKVKHGFFSDLHVHHGNILKYCARTEFMTEEEIRLLEEKADFKVSKDSIYRMNDALAEAINKDYGPDDVLWCLGDWCMGSGKYYLEDSQRFRNRINCKTIHYIWGNHDHREIASLFDSVNNMVEIAIDFHTGDYVIGEENISRKHHSKWQRIVLNHYMMAVWNGNHRGTWHLYGHSHAGAEEWGERAMPGRRSMDVGVDNIKRLFGEYRPISLEELKTFMDGRKGVAVDYPG